MKSAMVPEGLVTRLEAVLAELAEGHEGLLAAARKHREGVRRADGAGIDLAMREEGECVERIARADAERTVVVKQVTAAVGPGVPASAGRTVTVTVIAGLIAEPARTRLVAVSSRLRGLIAEVQREFRVIKSASDELAAHAAGLMRQVAHRLNHAGTYGDGSGSAPAEWRRAATPVVTSLDVVS